MSENKKKMRVIITEKQAISWGILKESAERGDYRTELSAKDGQIDIYYEDELETIRKMKSSGIDDISVVGKVIINWDLYYETNSFGVHNIGITIKSIEPYLMVEYYNDNVGYEETPLNLDLNSFSINSKVKAINGDLYPREIEIDFKSKTININ